MHQLSLKRQRFEHLCGNLKFAVAAVLFGMLVVGWVFHESVDPVTLYAWVITALIINLIRLWSYSYIKKRLDQPEHYPAIEQMFIMTAGATGLMWGMGSILFAMTTDMFYWVFLAFVLSGYAVSSILTLSASLPVCAAYFFPTILPITGWFFLQDDLRAPLMGIMLLMFIAGAWHIARKNNQIFLDNHTLFLEKAALSESLELQNRELQLARERSDEANASKSRFLAAASHDMRQPMQAMRLYLDVLAERISNSSNQTVITKLRTAHDDLSELLDRYLDIAQLDSGALIPKIQVFDLGKLLHQLHKQYLPSASAAGLSFQLHAPATETLVHSDPGFVKAILTNLISNALRHTHRGGILLTASRRGSAVQLEVWDNGPGIEESKQQHIFQDFVQLGNSGRDRNQGVGLGLAIASRACNLLGDRIRLNSKPGRGSVFSFEIPLALSSQPLETSHEATQEYISLAGMLVFVIDDDAQLRDALTLMLEQWQCEVLSFAGEKDALEGMQQLTGSPDAMIADYSLGNESTGIEVIRQLQTLAGKHIPALLLTGDTEPERLEQAVAANLPLLIKPVQASRLRLFLETSGGGGYPRFRVNEPVALR